MIAQHSILQHDFGLTVRPWPGLDDSRWLVVNASQEDDLGVMLTARDPGFAGAFESVRLCRKIDLPHHLFNGQWAGRNRKLLRKNLNVLA